MAFDDLIVMDGPECFWVTLNSLEWHLLMFADVLYL